jgi:glutathione peroxidase-family protein
MKLLFFITIFASFLMLSSISKSQNSSAAEIGKPAPHFHLNSFDGKIYNLDEFKGKIVVLEWVNFDCPFVVKHYGSGNMQKIQKEYTEKGIVWLSICSSAPGKQGNFERDVIKARISEAKANMSAYLMDEDGVVGKLYSARTTPHMYIINKDGNLVYQGAIDDIKSTDQEDVKKANNYVKNALDELLGGKPVTTSSTMPYGCSVKYNK